MKRFGNALCVSAVLLASLSCNRTAPEGYVSFSLEQSDDVMEMTKAKVSEYAALPSSSDFTIELKDSYSSLVWSGKTSAWDSSTPLMAGSYTVTASFGDNSDEGFGKPCFSGSRQFSVTEAGMQSVTIPVALSNCIVRVACSSTFRNYFPSYTFTITTAAGTEISFPKGESRAAFIDAYKFSVSGVMTNQAGVEQSFSKEYSNLEEASCYTLYFDMDSVGGRTMTISFDDSTETVDLGTVDLNK